MNHERNRATQVVEHHNFFGQHQQNIRGTDVIPSFGWPDAGFYVAHGIVAEVADEPTGKTLVCRRGRYLETRLVIMNKLEWVFTLVLLDNPGISFNRHIRCLNADHGPARQSDNGKAAPLFTALYGFEKVTVGAAPKFEISAKRGLRIGQHFSHYRNTVIALPG